MSMSILAILALGMLVIGGAAVAVVLLSRGGRNDGPTHGDEGGSGGTSYGSGD